MLSPRKPEIVGSCQNNTMMESILPVTGAIWV